jgi:hypothetical protein
MPCQLVASRFEISSSRVTTSNVLETDSLKSRYYCTHFRLHSLRWPGLCIVFPWIGFGAEPWHQPCWLKLHVRV